MIQSRLLEIRIMRKYTTRALAMRSGVSHVTITRIENDQSDPRLSTLIALSKALRVPITELYEEK